jgi:chromosome segregation ATPase
LFFFPLLLQFARQADDLWYIAYQDESTQWCSQMMDLEEKVANLADELAHKNLMIFELKHTVEEEKKNSELIRKEKLILETDLAVFDQVVENLERELQVMREAKSRFIWEILLGVIPVLAVMWLW